MRTTETIGLILLIAILIMLIWNICEFWLHRRTQKKDSEYFDLRAKLNFITATGSLFILLITYLGFDVKRDIIEKSDPMIQKLINEKRHEIDSLLASKNILKAGIYIVSDLDFKEDDVYKFDSLKTIDNKDLPSFHYVPKLIINTSTGENLRIKKITKTYFILEKPQSKALFLALEQDNPKYKPIKLKFDVWIADYKTED